MKNFNPNHDKKGRFAKSSNIISIAVGDNCKVKHEIQSAISQINKKFSNLKLSKYVNNITEKDFNSPNELGRREGKTIYIRKNVTNEYAFRTKDKQPIYFEGGNKYIKNSKDFSFVVIHEIGHAISGEDNSFCDKFAEQFNLDVEEIAKQLSYYANYNNTELFAEAFTDYIINGENASEIGKTIPKFLKEQGIIE